MKIWQWLSGKKTIFGTAFFLLAWFAQEVLLETWQFQAEIMPNIIATLEWCGVAFGGVGLAHKGKKALVMDTGAKP